eukprot:CAMPEP_0172424082 /NCGR_PEP_ID=MMETSP1064-20121228/21229_1 /TAXON_ID=202472 /ORGANISM="Aulacoseira subarctica , Strain CCAP 1002/5" /LENGTH=283 /DNA_ID=CAMNT_0013165835 /DNA_START=19 /DNA_END=873 /DNA_ORIENTATION=+
MSSFFATLFRTSSVAFPVLIFSMLTVLPSSPLCVVGFTDAALLFVRPSNIRRRCAAGGRTSATNSDDKQEYDLFDYFDPRVSPHLYPGGIPAPEKKNIVASIRAEESFEEESSFHLRTTSTMVNKVGVLLIDHGSKRESSNLHLESIAKAYEQSSRCPPHYIVRAAHMEIASPSIEDGLRNLVANGAYRIVCHPMFLSLGKHAMEDVPRLIEEATKSIQMDPTITNKVEIVTTVPLGSRVEVLIDAIGNIVEETIKSKTTFRQSKSNELGGFFGDIMKMMEDQ